MERVMFGVYLEETVRSSVLVMLNLQCLGSWIL